MKTFIIAIVLIVIGYGAHTSLQKPSTPEMTKTDEVMTETPTPVSTQVAAYKDISPREAKQLIDTNPSLVILDVSSRYAEGRIPGAINYYVGDGSLTKAIPSLDKMATYLVYCHVDSASIQGAQMLIDAGFSTVYRLEGNYAAWVEAGYEVEK